MTAEMRENPVHPHAALSNAELDRRLFRTRSLRERAALVGIDFAAARSTSLRIAVGAVLTTIAAVVLSVIATAAVFVASGGGWQLETRPLLGGYTALLVAHVIALCIGSVLAMMLVRIPSPRQLQVWSAAWVVAETLAIVVAATLGGDPAWAVGMVIAAFALPHLTLLGVLGLPWMLLLPLPGTTASVRTHQSLPPWQTVLGGQARWVVGAHVSLTVATVAATTAIVLEPLSALAVVVVRCVAEVAAARFGSRGQRRLWLGAQVAAAVAVSVLAVVVG